MKDNLIVASKLLGDFNNFLGKRSTTFLTWLDGMLDNILKWHFHLWKEEHEYLGDESKLEIWSMYSRLSRTMDSILREIETRALKERGSFSFFKKLEKHAEKYKKASASYSNYSESLFDTFYQVFFEHIYDSPERYDIWNHYFPKEWKVTKSNLQNLENVISEISLNKFFEWLYDRMRQARVENDYALDDVSNNLFPEVAPILWAKVLIFIFSQYGEDRLRSVIERPWNFGFMGRVKVYRVSQEEEIGRIHAVEEKSTFELAYFLFKEQFSMIKLEGYIKLLEELSYPKESDEERKRLRLHSLFTKMLNFVRDKEQSDLTQSDKNSTP